MASFSNYLENKILDMVLRNVAYTAPTTVYVALYTSDPTDANVGTEVSGGSYARQSVTFGAASNGVAANSADVTFPIASAAWGTITHVGILDASSGGNLLFHGALASAKSVGSSEQFKMATGGLTITLD